MGEITEEELTSLPDLLAPVLHRWKLVFVLGLIGGVLGLLLAGLITPRYASSVTVAPVEPDGGQMLASNSVFGQLGSLVGFSGLSGGNFSRDAEGVLRSDSIIREFIDEGNLIPILFPDSWDDNVDPPGVSDAVSKFAKDVRGIDVDKATGLLKLTINWEDPVLSARWANRFIELTNEAVRERTLDETELSSKYLAEELEKAQSLELRNAIVQLMETNVRTAMLANTREQFAFNVIDPAFPADEDDYAWPNKKLLAVLGGVLGGGVAIAWILIGMFLRETRR